MILGVIVAFFSLCLSGCATAEKKEPPKKKYRLYAAQIVPVLVACLLGVCSLAGCVHLDARSQENPISENDKDTVYMGVQVPMGEAKEP